MANRSLVRLLGSDAPDPGCARAFEHLDVWAEVVLSGADTEPFAALQAHLRHCVACREDADGLLAALRALRPPK